MAINLHEKYSDKIKQVYTHNSFVEGKTNQEYSFVGVKTVKIPNLITQDLNDYQRTGTNRYGTPNELQDAMQELSVTQDKSFAITIDKGNNVEQQMMKQAGRVMEAEMREKVTPTSDKYALAQYAANAGHTIAYDAAVAKSNIISKLLDIEVYFEDNFVPTDRRYVFVKNTHIAMIKLSSEFQYADSAVDKLLMKGIVGKIGTLNIVGVPAAYMPANVEHIAFQSNSVMLPFKIKDSRIHQDPPGLSGHLLEGRFMYDAFVIGAICDGVVVVVAKEKKCAAPTVTKGTTTAIATTTSDAEVYYTTDGSDPRWSTTRTKYSAAIANPTAGTIIKAYATYISGGMYPSDVVTHKCV